MVEQNTMRVELGQRVLHYWRDGALPSPLAVEIAAATVVVGPDLTGFAPPRGFGVYVGDHATCQGCTKEEAERIAEPYRRAVAVAVQMGIERAG